MKKRMLCFTIGAALLLTACEKKVENQEIPISINSQDVTAAFTGTLKDGKPVGEGTFSVNVDDDQWSYAGTFENGLITGSGTLKDYPISATFSDTNYNGTYTGDTTDGIPNGSGKFICNLDDLSVTYEGTWKDGTPSDKGHLSSDNFTVKFADVERTGIFDGDVLNGIADGTGTFTATNSYGETYTYTGEWKNNIFNGQGEVKYEDAEYLTQKGNFVEGDFTPTKAEYIQYAGSGSEFLFTLSEENKKFIEENDFLFPAADPSLLQEYLSSDLTYAPYIKKPSAFHSKLMDSGLKYVLQIAEYDLEGTGFDTYTYILASSEALDEIYYIYYFGKLDDILVGDVISLKGLPIDYTTYTNIQGGNTWSVIMVGSDIQKR